MESPALAPRLPRPHTSRPARPLPALRPPLSSRSPLGRLCSSAAASVAAPAPSSASPPPPPPGASGGRLSGWPRASAVASASRQRLPQEEARRPRSRSGPQFSPSFRRRGSWRSGRGRGTGRRGSNGRRTGGYPYLRMRGSPDAVALPPRPPPTAVSTRAGLNDIEHRGGGGPGQCPAGGAFRRDSPFFSQARGSEAVALAVGGVWQSSIFQPLQCA